MSEVPNVLSQLFGEIENNKLRYIENLKIACAIKSVSAWPETRPEIQKMVEWTADKLRGLGTEIKLVDIGKQVLQNGSEIPLPNVILGTLGKDPKKKTVVVYGHLDVQPALKDDGWNTEPFELTEIDGKLYARGATDDKGPVLCWIHAIEAYQKLKIDLPVNIKFVFEGMEESGSEGLDDLLIAQKVLLAIPCMGKTASMLTAARLIEEGSNSITSAVKPVTANDMCAHPVSLTDDFLANVDFVCISDNYWLGKNRPCLTYGLRGIAYYNIEVECAVKDLHSGVFGGTVHEAMPDLIYLLNTLLDHNGKILIPGIYKDVAPLLANENEIYQNIDYDVNDYRSDIGANKLPHNEDKTQLLMHRWRYPSLSVHGIEGAFYEHGQKTVIPAKVIGKFSMRLVPNQEPDQVTQCVIDHLNAKWAERGSPNKFKVELVGAGKPWTENPNHPHYEAAKRAVKHVFNVEPDMTREGGSIPVTLTLQEATGKNVILIPVGASDDGAHSQNEKIDIRNYMEGTKLLGAYLYEIGSII